jgi:hypothetical protein
LDLTASYPRLEPTSTVADLANALNGNLVAQLDDRQFYAVSSPQNYRGVGRIPRGPSSPPPGPTQKAEIAGLATQDSWKAAASAQTVTRSGIIDKTKRVTLVASAGTALLDASGRSNFGAWALASAINHNADS